MTAPRISSGLSGRYLEHWWVWR